MKLKEILDMIQAEIMEQLTLAEDGGAGGSNAVKAKSKGTVGKTHGRELPPSKVPARDGKAEKMFNQVAKGDSKGKRVVKQAQKLDGAKGDEWPAGVWAIATDQTIDKKVPKGSGQKGPTASPGAAKSAQKKAVKATGNTGKGSGRSRRTFKPGKTSKDKRQIDLFKKK